MLLLMFRILYKYRYSYGIEDIGLLSHDVLSSAMRESTNPSNFEPSMMPLASVHNKSDEDDSDEDD